MSVRARCAAILVLALVGSLSACGGEEPVHHDAPAANGIADLQPAAALRRAFRATRHLDAVVYAGSGSYEYPTGVKPVNGRFTFTASGSCAFVGRSDEMGRVTLRLVGKHEYLHADATALTAGFGVDGARAKDIQAAWFAGPATKGDAQVCSLDEIVKLSADTRKCNAMGVGQVDGTPVSIISCPGPTTPITFYLATVGAPLVVRVTGTDAEGAYDLRLVSSESRRVHVPRGPSVVDVSKLFAVSAPDSTTPDATTATTAPAALPTDTPAPSDTASATEPSETTGSSDASSPTE